MEEVLLFTNSLEMTPVIEKICLAYPGTQPKFHEREKGGTIPVTLEIAALSNITFYIWAQENDVLRYCQNWVLLTLAPPGWAVPIIEAFKNKEETSKQV